MKYFSNPINFFTSEPVPIVMLQSWLCSTTASWAHNNSLCCLKDDFTLNKNVYICKLSLGIFTQNPRGQLSTYPLAQQPHLGPLFHSTPKHMHMALYIRTLTRTSSHHISAPQLCEKTRCDKLLLWIRSCGFQRLKLWTFSDCSLQHNKLPLISWLKSSSLHAGS